MPIAAEEQFVEFMMGLGTCSDLAIEFIAFGFDIKEHFDLAINSDLFSKRFQYSMERWTEFVTGNLFEMSKLGVVVELDSMHFKH